MSDATADALGVELRHHYESGRSIRDLSLETSYSISRVRSLLHRADTPIRDRGAPHSVPAESSDPGVYDTGGE
ncbi:MAG: helix-turn-helix domain-containing protein, partial [Thermomicrobiales bacterium]